MGPEGLRQARSGIEIGPLASEPEQNPTRYASQLALGRTSPYPRHSGSWTLKADLVSEYVCCLLNHMDKHGYVKCVAREGPSMERTPMLDMSSARSHSRRVKARSLRGVFV